MRTTKKPYIYSLSLNLRSSRMADCFTSHFPIQTLRIDGILISYEPSSFMLAPYFSNEEQELFGKLVEQVQIQPKQALILLLQWKEKHPSVAIIDNVLTYAYLQNKERQKAELLIEESYAKYPSYFFAKINYADQCLRKKTLSKIPTIFPSFDLKELFPEKEKFHVSEFRGFMVFMSYYQIAMKNRSKAKEYYEKAYQADPTHPSVVQLERKLFPPSLFKKCWKGLQKLAGISKIP